MIGLEDIESDDFAKTFTISMYVFSGEKKLEFQGLEAKVILKLEVGVNVKTPTRVEYRVITMAIPKNEEIIGDIAEVLLL